METRVVLLKIGGVGLSSGARPALSTRLQGRARGSKVSATRTRTTSYWEPRLWELAGGTAEPQEKQEKHPSPGREPWLPWGSLATPRTR